LETPSSPLPKLKSQEDIDAYCSDQFLVCVDTALDRYGESVKVVVYHALQNEFGLTRQDISSSPERLAIGLEKFFGVGSKPVEKAILHEMKEFSGIKDLDQRDLLTALKRVRHHLNMVASEIGEV